MPKFKVTWLKHYEATSFVEAETADEAIAKVEKRQVDIDDEVCTFEDAYEAEEIQSAKGGQ